MKQDGSRPAARMTHTYITHKTDLRKPARGVLFWGFARRTTPNFLLISKPGGVR